MMIRIFLRALVGAIVACTWSGVVLADITEPEEWAKRVKTAEQIGVLGPDLFGDSVNFYNGQTTFTVTDIDIPGNSKLPVRVTRSFVAAQREDNGTPGLLGNWELDVPYMSGVYGANNGWQATRCSANLAPGTATGTGANPVFGAGEYWRGITLSVPGHGN
jgi:hypothetical protein